MVWLGTVSTKTLAAARQSWSCNPPLSASVTASPTTAAPAGYPAELFDVLVRHCGFSHSTVVADVGAGTGLLTRLFLDATPFLRGYEDLLIRLCPEYLRGVHRKVGERAVGAFFAPCPFDQVVLDNRQVFDSNGLEYDTRIHLGRLH